MIVKTYGGKTPRIDPTARIAENAVLVGDVTIGAHASIWYGAVLRGDNSAIVIGENTNIQDGCLLHGDVDEPVAVGKDCTVGHGAILHSCHVADNCLIGMGAVLLNGCEIGAGALVAAGALVRGGMTVAPRAAVMGMPAKVTRETSEADLAWFREDVAHYLEIAQQLPACGEEK
ncbi:MAG: gamma carbonic anhydrase family protein [Oscillospiraceae bacterium]|nr:gamma carbonic anhydrase family protein [Oscillospiraceae bacterium]